MLLGLWGPLVIVCDGNVPLFLFGYLDLFVQNVFCSMLSIATLNTSRTALSVPFSATKSEIRHIHRPEKEALKGAILSI